jgi:hypothetical protein
MPAFIEARTDPFAERREQAAREIRESGRDFYNVRRPTRGIEIKEDTYAIMRVALRDGRFLPVIDAAGEIINNRDGKGYTTSYSNFLISTVQEDRREKQQIVESFGDTYIFFFGESPRIFNVSGILLNTKDFNWRAEWWENYERFFRGTRLVEHGARLYLIYDDIIVEGYMIGSNAVDDVNNPYMIQLQFQLFLTGYTNISLIGNPNYPRPEGGIDYSQPSSYGEALAEYQSSVARQRELTGDAVRRLNEQAGLGSKALLSDALKQGLEKDAGLSSFLTRSKAAIGGAKTTPDGQPDRTAEARTSIPQVALRGAFRDNVDEFVARQEPSAEELAAPLSRADAWLDFDRRADDLIDEKGYDKSSPEVADVLGRSGRSLSAMGKSIGPRIPRDGLPSGTGRTTRPRGMREVPFGLTAVDER